MIWIRWNDVYVLLREIQENVYFSKDDCTGRKTDFRKFGPYKYVANL